MIVLIKRQDNSIVETYIDIEVAKASVLMTFPNAKFVENRIDDEWLILVFEKGRGEIKYALQAYGNLSKPAPLPI
jgi:hypothetical protein